jgi:hypothetical protein
MSTSSHSAGGPAAVSCGTAAKQAPALSVARPSPRDERDLAGDCVPHWHVCVREIIDLLDAAHAAFPSSAEGCASKAVLRVVSEKLDELESDLESIRRRNHESARVSHVVDGDAGTEEESPTTEVVGTLRTMRVLSEAMAANLRELEGCAIDRNEMISGFECIESYARRGLSSLEDAQ